MKQVKRLFYMILLNVLISAITVGVILQLWERNHPPVSTANTPVVVVVTSTQAVILPIIGNNADMGVPVSPGSGAVITGTVQANPTFAMLSYRVKEGDSLGALSLQFNVSVADIMTVNGLEDPDNLLEGQIIYIPTAPLPTATPVPPTVAVSPTPRPSATPTYGPTRTPTPTLTGQEPEVFIETVIGAGVLGNERVVLRRTGDGELSLAGWRLTDGKGNEYVFPQLTLYEDGAVNLNTRSGQNTVVDLFWGLTIPIWSQGESISLYDAQNSLRSSYTIP